MGFLAWVAIDALAEMVLARPFLASATGPGSR